MKNIFILSALLMTPLLKANVKPFPSQEEIKNQKYDALIDSITSLLLTNNSKLAKECFDELVKHGFKPLNIAIDVLSNFPGKLTHYKRAHTFFIKVCNVKLSPLEF